MSRLLRKAAQRLEQGVDDYPYGDGVHHEGACLAIDLTWWKLFIHDLASVNDSERTRAWLAQWFKPASKTVGSYWFGAQHVEANRDRRILALCFAACLAEDAGD